MNLKKLRMIVVATVILGITWSCQKEEDLSPEMDKSTLDLMNIGMTQLVKQLEKSIFYRKYGLLTVLGMEEKKGEVQIPFNYTGIVEDMIDDISGYDQVSGYSIRQIEDALQSKKTWNE